MDSSSKRSHRSKRANGVYVEDEVDVEQNASKRSKTGARLSSSLRHLLLRVLVTLMKHPSAVPFNFPVDTVQVPDYLTVIKRPMDFSTIQNQLEAGVYATPEEFATDVRQVFINCWTYNLPDSFLFNSATTLSSIFEYLFREVQIQQQQAQQDSAVIEMQNVIDQLRAEHTKLMNELHKLKSARQGNVSPVLPPPPPKARIIAKQPKKPPKSGKPPKEKKKKEKSPKIRTAPSSTPKINTLPIVYKYEYADQERLSKKIERLTQENVQKMVDVLSADIAEFQKISGEVEIDLENLNDASLSRLEQFVDDCLKQQERGDNSTPAPPITHSSNTDSNIPGNDSDSSSESDQDDEE